MKLTTSKFLETFEKIVEAKKDDIADNIAKKAEKTVDDLNDSTDEDESIADMEWDDSLIETEPTSNLLKFDYMRLHDYISLSYRTKKPLLIYGDPGIGKSQMVQQFVRSTAKAKQKEFVDWDEASLSKQRDVIRDPSKYFLFIDMRSDSMDPTDLAGIPDLNNKEEWLETKMPKWLYVMAQESADGVLFLDELNNGEPSMLKALYKIVDKKVGNIKLSPEFGIIGAGNLGAEFGGNPIPQALTNRFDQGILIADAEQWLDYAEREQVDKRIIAFVKAQPEINFNQKPAGGFTGAATHIQWASPRALKNLSDFMKQTDRAYAEARKEGVPIQTPKLKVFKEKAIGFCGETWGRSFDAFMRHFKSFDYADIVKKADDSLLQGEDRDKLHALLIFILGKLTPVLKRLERTKEELSEEDKGVFIGLAKILNSFKPEWKTNLFSHFKKDLSVEQIEILMTFLLRGDYDEKVKTSFVKQTLPTVKEFI
jgi:MoxR-like ATPase